MANDLAIFALALAKRGGGGGGGFDPSGEYPDLHAGAADALYVEDAQPVTAEQLQPRTAVSSAFPSDGVMADNVEYRIGTVTELDITGFAGGVAGYTALWSVVFTAGTGITVSVPDSVTWAVADPVFEAEHTYWLSFMQMGSGYLGVWSVAQ